MDISALRRVISVSTGKGGTFKTSVSANVAGLCAAGGYPTLLVDLDPQGDLSDDLGYYSDERLDNGQHLATAMLTGTELRPILTDVRANLDVIPGGDFLSDVGGALVARQSRGGVKFDLLANSLAPIASEYDLVLIDTPPTDDTLQLLALRASRWLIVPTTHPSSPPRSSAADT